ncbi:MAG: electron transfer flavoprotein subunit beta [Thermomicrobiales bacterium]
MGYRIVVLVRQVPDLNAARINHSTGEIQFSGQMVINSFDDYAIEEALRLKEAHGGEVTVVTVGPAGARDAVVRALAMGADNGVLLQVDQAHLLDAAALASLLTEAIKPLQPDIVICGQMSDDFGAGEVGPAIAVSLGIPQVSSATSVVADGSTLTILRDTEDGKQQVSVDTPVLIMAMTGLNAPRYPSLKGIMAARKKPIDVITPASVPVSRTTWSTPFVQERDTTGIILQDVPPAEAAQKLVAWLREQKLV